MDPTCFSELEIEEKSSHLEVSYAHMRIRGLDFLAPILSTYSQAPQSSERSGDRNPYFISRSITATVKVPRFMAYPDGTVLFYEEHQTVQTL